MKLPRAESSDGDQPLMPFGNVVRNWFKHEWGGSLHLPDGWYGRPFDSQHSLTSVSEVGIELIVLLDGVLTLRFEGLKSVRQEGKELVFGPFDCLQFVAMGMDENSAVDQKMYETGEVRIISNRVTAEDRDPL